MKRKTKPEPEANTRVRWIPVLDIQSLAAVKTFEDIVALIRANKAKIASKPPPRTIPVFTAEEAAQIRRSGDSTAPSSSGEAGISSDSDSPPDQLAK